MTIQVRRLFWVVAAMCLAAPASATAEAVETSHQIDYDAVTVEHAELVLSPGGLRDAAYLTIFNGTAQDVAIDSITVAGYSNSFLMTPVLGSAEFEETRLQNAFVMIPRKAELDMGPDTVFIALDRISQLPPTATMEIGFADGTSRTIPLTILDDRSPETSHHHGDVGRE